MAKYGDIELGDRVKARVNGFTGIAGGVTEYLHQCRQVLVLPEKLTSDGGQVAGVWIDEPWLEIVQKGIHKPAGAAYDPLTQKVASGAIDSHPTPSIPSSKLPGGA